MEEKRQSGALNLLSHIYHKISVINLTQDTHEELKIYDGELSEQKGYSEKISEWFQGFARSGQVYEDDVEQYLRFTNMEHLREVFYSGKTYVCCHYRRKVGNEFRWVSMELVPDREYTHENQVLCLFVKDIHDQFVVDIREKDFLTGGMNRRGFLRYGREVIDGSSEEQQFAILAFNIKGFKAVNELFGMEGGDEVLRQIYFHIKTSPLQLLILARTEGDRFLGLMEQAMLDYECLKEICKTSVTRDGKKISIYLKCGVYLVEDKSVNLNTMCDWAKLAKRHIVDEFIKPYAVFSRSMRSNYLGRAEIQSRIIEALEQGELKVYYQPIFHAKTGQIVSAEALVRWEYPKKGLVSPGIFIPAIEESGHITKVDFFVVNEVKKLQEKRRKNGQWVIPISVNLSWMDFYDQNMMEMILYDLNHWEDEQVKMRFEVTETSYAAMVERDENVIKILRQNGAEILLDDFGSGYSSFSTVRDYDFDLIKLDMGFVKKIGTGAKVKSIIHSIIDMSHYMNAKVVAEGVETKEQLDFLIRHDCDYIQGYYFSKPLPEEEFEYVLEHGVNREMTIPAKKELSITDLIDRKTLQKMQDAFAGMTGMAALMTDRDGEPVTKGSNFTEFCMKYTRGSKIGLSRCRECDRNGAEKALNMGTSCAYTCHAGLVDYAAPIMANGEMIGCFIGGQVLTEVPALDTFRRTAEELGLSEEEYINAVQRVNIVEKRQIDNATNFLYIMANIISDFAYNKYMLNLSNALLREKNMELNLMANYDLLTKLHNRHHMQEYFRSYHQSGRVYCLVIGDIDDFKMVNDTYGHDCGDMVLQRVAETIQNHLNDRGVACRWGGEEFLLLIDGDKRDVIRKMEEIRNSVSACQIEYEGQKVRVTMTFGMACCEERTEQEKLVNLADRRLYQGKIMVKTRWWQREISP